MGSATFETTVRVRKATTDQEAFEEARSQAQYDSGHGGYTGTIGEKGSFVMIARAKSARNASRMAAALLDGGGRGISAYREEMRALVDDKWGPAGAIRYPIDRSLDGVLFFGWASC